MLRLFQQAFQRPEIDRVELLSVAFALLGFEVHRDVGETRVVDDVSERLHTKKPFADVFVPIHAATERLLAVVEMPSANTFHADGLVELGHRRGVLRGRLQWISGGNDVARIDTDAESLGIADFMQHQADLLEAMTETRPLPGGCFEPKLTPHTNRARVNLIQRCDDPPLTGLF